MKNDYVLHGFVDNHHACRLMIYLINVYMVMIYMTIVDVICKVFCGMFGCCFANLYLLAGIVLLKSIYFTSLEYYLYNLHHFSYIVSNNTPKYIVGYCWHGSKS